MILPSQKIRVYDSTLANDGSYFTGGLNLQQLEFDPLLTGYGFIFWIKLPTWVTNNFSGFKNMTQKNFKSFDGISDIELQTQAYQYGFSQNEYNVAAGIQKGNTEFTLKHQEYSGSPIKNAYQYWVSGIFDPETGISPYGAIHNIDYAAKNHTGSLLYIATRPDANNVNMKNIEFAAFYTNVFPTKMPLQHFNMGESHDLVEIEQTFKGTMHIGPYVDAYAAEYLQNAYTFVTEPMFDPSLDGTQYDDKTITYFPKTLDETTSGDGLGDISTTIVATSNTTA
jgi:hypothetical protein